MLWQGCVQPTHDQVLCLLNTDWCVYPTHEIEREVESTMETGRVRERDSWAAEQFCIEQQPNAA